MTVVLSIEGAHHLDQDEVDEAREGVKRWIQREQELLDRLMD